MFKGIRLLILLVFSISFAAAGFLPVHSARDGSIVFSGAINQDGVCSHGFVETMASYIPDVDDGYGGDSVGYTLVDGYGTPIAAYLGYWGVGNDPATENMTFPLGTVNGAINDITARPVTVRLYDTTLSIYEIDGWTSQQLFDAFTTEGTLLDQDVYDPAFVLDFCNDLPVPGYHFSRLDVQYVCTSTPGYATWRIRNYNPYGVRYTYRIRFPEVNGVDFAPGTLYPNHHPPYWDTELNTPAAFYGPTILQIFVNGRLQDVAIGLHRSC